MIFYRSFLIYPQKHNLHYISYTIVDNYRSFWPEGCMSLSEICLLVQHGENQFGSLLFFQLISLETLPSLFLKNSPSRILIINFHFNIMILFTHSFCLDAIFLLGFFSLHQPISTSNISSNLIHDQLDLKCNHLIFFAFY